MEYNSKIDPLPTKIYKSSICNTILKYRRMLEGKINTQEMLYMVTTIAAAAAIDILINNEIGA